MAKKENTKSKTTTKKSKEAPLEIKTIEVPLTVGFDQSRVIGVARVIVGDHLKLMPNMVLAPAFVVKDIEFNNEGKTIKQELTLIELSLITPQVANPTRISKVE